MTYYVDIQNAQEEEIPLSEEEITHLAIRAAQITQSSAELTIRLVTPDEMTHLNHTYRKKNKPTNVLAFPSEIPNIVALDCPLLGDIIICPKVLFEESIEQHKPIKEHWTLIVIHGVLHLLGYDHIKEEDATVMQAIEITLLAEMGYNNPYHAKEYDVE
jgi:probable rRNA maturation factor